MCVCVCVCECAFVCVNDVCVWSLIRLHVYVSVSVCVRVCDAGRDW